MLQIALEAILIAPPCSNFHQKVNAQSFLCPGQGYSKLGDIICGEGTGYEGAIIHT